MPTIGELIVKMRAESAVFTQNMEQNRRTVDTARNSIVQFGEHGSRGFKRVENAAAGLGLGMLGLHGKTEQLISGMLLLGAGGQVALLVTAGIAAILLAVKEFTTGVEKAREEQDKLVESLKKRLDPNTGLNAEAAAAAKQFGDLQAQIKSLEEGPTRRLAISSFGEPAVTAQLQRLKAELAVADAERIEADQLVKKKWTDEHPLVTLIGTPQMDVLKEALRIIDEATVKLGTSPWAELIKKSNEKWSKGLSEGIDAAFEKNKDFVGTIHRPEIFEKMERDAKLWEETWKNATRGVQDAFAQMFEQIGQKGFRLVSLLEAIARAVQKSLAQLAAQKLVDLIFGGLGMGGGGIPGAPGLGNVGDNPIPSLSSSAARGPTVHVHMSYAPQVQALDQSGVQQVLDRHGHLFVGKTMEAFAGSPNLARFVVATGLR